VRGKIAKGIDLESGYRCHGLREILRFRPMHRVMGTYGIAFIVSVNNVANEDAAAFQHSAHLCQHLFEFGRVIEAVRVYAVH